MDLIMRIREARHQLLNRNVLPLTAQHQFLCVLTVEDLMWCKEEWGKEYHDINFGLPDGMRLVLESAECQLIAGHQDLEGCVFGKQPMADGREMIVGIKLIQESE